MNINSPFLKVPSDHFCPSSLSYNFPCFSIIFKKSFDFICPSLYRQLLIHPLNLLKMLFQYFSIHYCNYSIKYEVHVFSHFVINSNSFCPSLLHVVNTPVIFTSFKLISFLYSIIRKGILSKMVCQCFCNTKSHFFQ